MIDLSKYRIIDLSREIVPGERKVDRKYLHREPSGGRPAEIQDFFAYEARMHFIQGQTHTGTHSEAPYKYSDTGADAGSMPLETYIGEAAACNFSAKRPGSPITPDDLKRAGVKPRDIVLIWGSGQGDPPHLTEKAADWLIETRVKALSLEGVAFSPPGTPFGPTFGDTRMMLGGIAMIDGPIGLSQIKKPRVFVIALPVKMRRVTASWTRFIALEELGQ